MPDLSVDWPSQYPEELVLEAGPYRATVAPAAGGRLGSLSCSTDGQTVELLVPLPRRGFEPHAWPKAGAFPMVPFSNRMPAGPWRIADREVDLPRGPTGGPVHGFGHRRPWQVLLHSPSEVRMALLHDGTSEGWPWAFRAEQHVSLSERGCEVTLSMTCLDDSHPMPVAMGWHPYHPLSGTAQDPALHLTAQEVLELDDFGFVSRNVGRRPRHWSPVPGATVALEHWGGVANSTLSSNGARLIVETSGFAHAVLHRPAEQAYVCLEPVSLLPGTLLATSSGVTLLNLGETAVGTWRCSLGTSPTPTPTPTPPTATADTALAGGA